MDAATIAAAAASALALVVVILNSWVSNRNARRVASGSVGTSSADIVFTTQTDMLHTALAENTKLVDQRDRLVASFERIVPLIESIVETQKADGLRQARILTLLEGGVHEPVPAPPPVASA